MNGPWSPPTGHDSSKRYSIENITAKYLFALGILAVLALAVYAGLVLIIETYETSGAVINISGRHRMLTQRIARLAHDVMHETGEKRKKYRKELAAATDFMDKSHNMLLSGDKELNIPATTSPAIHAMYFDEPMLLDKRIRSFIAAAKALSQEADASLVHGNKYMDIIEEASHMSLLIDLDTLVSQYQKEGEQEVGKLQSVAIITLLLILLVLVLEGIFIFRPMERRISIKTDKLALSERKLRDITSTLGEGVIVMDNHGGLSFMNPEAEKLLGWTESELMGENIHEKIHHIKADGSPNPVHDCILIETLATGMAHSAEEDAFVSKDGQVIPISVVATPIRENGNVGGAVIAFRDITLRKEMDNALRTEKEHTQLLQEIAVNSNEASTVSEAMLTCMEKVCAYTGWAVGHVFIPDSSGYLKSTGLWRIEDKTKFANFRKATEQAVFAPGEGLPGRVYKNGEPAWITDLSKDTNFPRLKMADDLGVRAGFAFPVLEGNKVVAVLEFFNTIASEPDEELLDTIKYLAVQLGRVTERKRSEELLMESEKSLKKQVEKMEHALSRTENVLHTLAKAPRLAPYFVTSRAYRFTKEVGGGDCIRWVSFDSRFAGILAHDVSGHDIEETLLNILATALADDRKIDPGTKSVRTPGDFLAEMNEGLKKYCEKSGHYVTAVYTLLDFEERNLRLALAGHPDQWLIGPDKSIVKVGEPGLMMGMFDISAESKDMYVDICFKLNERELLFIYTDGLMEQKNRKGVTFETVLQMEITDKIAGKNPDEAFAIVADAFDIHLEGDAPEDDVSFIFIGARPESEYKTFEIAILEPHNDNPGQRSVGTDEAALSKFFWRRESRSPRENEIVNAISAAVGQVTGQLEETGWAQEKIGQVEQTLMEAVANAAIDGEGFITMARNVEISHILHGDTLEIGVMQKASDETGQDGRGYSRDKAGLDVLNKNSDGVFFSETGDSVWLLFSKAG